MTVNNKFIPILLHMGIIIKSTITYTSIDILQ
uniref:Uncharacterized protein n=1 Tax=Myoviridae sp. ctkfK18 TaxID=2825165 RepID=A0A8S5VH17_9CAUD|nr:MAG TPA: hypothetical protein [Myoviridae sp. ctkfK18]